MPEAQVPKGVEQPCPRCGGRNFARGIALNQNADVGTIGLQYQSAWIFRSTEALLADLCEDCGTIVRFHVKEPKRKWYQS